MDENYIVLAEYFYALTKVEFWRGTANFFKINPIKLYLIFKIFSKNNEGVSSKSLRQRC